jgi:hypothetical protein
VDNLYPIDSGHMSSYDIFRAALTKMGVDFTVLTTSKVILVYSATDDSALAFEFDEEGNFKETYPLLTGQTRQCIKRDGNQFSN